MNEPIPLRRPGAEPGDRHEVSAPVFLEPFELYGRRHEVEDAEAEVAITRLPDGLHLDLRVRANVLTTCDRTLDPLELELEFGDSELLSGPDDAELSVEDWELHPALYAEAALKNEVPIQAFRPGTKPVEPEGSGEEVDPRWRGLDGLFASGF